LRRVLRINSEDATFSGELRRHAALDDPLVCDVEFRQHENEHLHSADGAGIAPAEYYSGPIKGSWKTEEFSLSAGELLIASSTAVMSCPAIRSDY
jgi:hypothetical protein